jgi:predicted RNA-binding Zn-ribbon protein involved in translation (DUF1610 family)
MSENLTKCPDCNQEVSKTAKVCPNCGNKKLLQQQRQQQFEAKWQALSPLKRKVIFIAFVCFVVLYILISLFSYPDKCECNKLMSKYGILKGDNQFVPESDKDIHMRCVKTYLTIPTNEDGSDPCN